MDTLEIEERLLREFDESGELDADALDCLLFTLLGRLHGYSGRATDGVFVGWASSKGNVHVGSGVVVMVNNQCVEPFRVDFSASESRKELEGGYVFFGDRNRSNVAYDSREHRRISKELIIDPLHEYAWKATFIRKGGAWVCSTKNDRE